MMGKRGGLSLKWRLRCGLGGRLLEWHSWRSSREEREKWTRATYGISRNLISRPSRLSRAARIPIDQYPVTALSMRKAKIVCTIGPASNSPTLLDHLIESGMDAARLNFSHGTHESHARAVKAIREAADRRQVAVAIIQDLQGPRIRVGAVDQGGLDLVAGQKLRLVTTLLRSGGQLGVQSITPSGMREIPVTYQYLVRDVLPGARILIDDGLIELMAVRITGGAVECGVVTGGRLTSHKGMNLPDTRISAPTSDRQRSGRSPVRYRAGGGLCGPLVCQGSR